MDSFKNYRLPIEQGAKFAALGGIALDLRATIDCCDFLMSVKGQEMNFLVWDGMSSAAVIRYARCFGKGGRIALEHRIVEKAPDHLQSAHKFFIAMRNMHVAHSVNDFEENEVAVMIGDRYQTSEEIMSVSTGHGSVIGFATDQPQRLKALAKWLTTEVEAMMQTEREQLLEYVRSRPLKELKQYGVVTIGEGGTRENVNKRRVGP